MFLHQNLSEGKYKSFDEFKADAQLILHNTAILYGGGSQLFTPLCCQRRREKQVMMKLVCVCARALLSTHTHARLVDSVISFPGTGEQEVGSDRYSDMNVFHFIGVRVCF